MNEIAAEGDEEQIIELAADIEANKQYTKEMLETTGQRRLTLQEQAKVDEAMNAMRERVVEFHRTSKSVDIGDAIAAACHEAGTLLESLNSAETMMTADHDKIVVGSKSECVRTFLTVIPKPDWLPTDNGGIVFDEFIIIGDSLKQAMLFSVRADNYSAPTLQSTSEARKILSGNAEYISV